MESALDLLSAAAFAQSELRDNLYATSGDSPAPDHPNGLEHPGKGEQDEEQAVEQGLEHFPFPGGPFDAGLLPPLPPQPNDQAPDEDGDRTDEDGDRTDEDESILSPRTAGVKRPRDEEDVDQGRPPAPDYPHPLQQQPSYFPFPIPALASFPPSSLPPLPPLSSLPPLPLLPAFSTLPPIPPSSFAPSPVPTDSTPTSRSPRSIPHWVPEDAGLIRCVCPYTSDDGFTIQCDACNVWQHAGCIGISPDDVPDEYLCELCDPAAAEDRGVDGVKAEESQRRRMEAEMMRAETLGGAEEMRRVASIGLGAQVQQQERRERQQEQEQQRRQQLALQAQQQQQAQAQAQAQAQHAQQQQQRGKPKRSLTEDGASAEPALVGANGAGSATATPVAAGGQRGGRRRGGKQPITNGAGGRPRSAASSAVATPTAERHPDVPTTRPTSLGIHRGAPPPTYSDEEDIADEQYEPWQYEYSPVERNLYPDKGLVERLSAMLLGPEDATALATAPLKDLWERQNADRPRVGPNAKDPLVPLLFDTLPVEFDTLPTPAPTAVKAILTTALHLVPPVASTYISSSNQAPTCPYPRPAVHGLFATSSIPAGTYIAPVRGQVISLETYRSDPINQYPLLGVPKPGVHILPLPWSLAVDARKFGNEARFARFGCHPNAILRVVRVKPPRAPDADSATPPAPSSRSSTWRDQSRGGALSSLTFALFATSDIGKRDEIVLPWAWDDDHIVHALPDLMAAPPLPQGMTATDLEDLARKMHTVTTSLLGTNHCACEKKRDCALFWMCRAAGATAPLSRAAAAKREPFATIFLNAVGGQGGVGKEENGGGGGQGRGAKGRKAKKPDVGPLLGIERGWVVRPPREVRMVVEEVVEEELPKEEVEESGEPMQVDEEPPAPPTTTVELPPPTPSTSTLPPDAMDVEPSSLLPIPSPPPTLSKRRASTSIPKPPARAPPPKIEDGAESDGSDLTEPLSHRSDDDLEASKADAEEPAAEASSEEEEVVRAPVRRSKVPVAVKRTTKDAAPPEKKKGRELKEKGKGRGRGRGKSSARVSDEDDEDEPAAPAPASSASAPDKGKERAVEPPVVVKERHKKKQIVIIKKVTETLVEKPVDKEAQRAKKEKKERERERRAKEAREAEREEEREKERAEKVKERAEKEKEKEKEKERAREREESGASAKEAPPPRKRLVHKTSKIPVVSRSPSPAPNPQLEADIFDGPAEIVERKARSPSPSSSPPPPTRKPIVKERTRKQSNAAEIPVVEPPVEDVVTAEVAVEPPPPPPPSPPVVPEVVKEPTPPPPTPVVPPPPRARLSLAAYRQRQQAQKEPGELPSPMPTPSATTAEIVASPISTPSLAQAYSRRPSPLPSPNPSQSRPSSSYGAPAVPSSHNSAEDVLKRLGDYFSSQSGPSKPIAPTPSGPLSYTRPTFNARPSVTSRRETSATPAPAFAPATAAPELQEYRSPQSPAQSTFGGPGRSSYIGATSARTDSSVSDTTSRPTGALGLDAELPVVPTREYGRQPSVYSSSSYTITKAPSESSNSATSPSLYHQPLPAAFPSSIRSPSLQPPPLPPTGPRLSPTLRNFDRPLYDIPTGPRAALPASPTGTPGRGASFSGGGSGRGGFGNRPLPDVGAASPSPYASTTPSSYGNATPSSYGNPTPSSYGAPTAGGPTGASAVPLGPRGFGGAAAGGVQRASWPPGPGTPTPASATVAPGPLPPPFRGAGAQRARYDGGSGVPRGPSSVRGGRGGIVGPGRGGMGAPGGIGGGAGRGGIGPPGGRGGGPVVRGSQNNWGPRGRGRGAG